MEQEQKQEEKPVEENNSLDEQEQTKEKTDKTKLKKYGSVGNKKSNQTNEKEPDKTKLKKYGSVGHKKSNQTNEKGRVKRKRRKRRERKKEEPLEVTLETEIPKLPPKSTRLDRPDDKDLREAIDEIESEIRKIRDARQAYVRELEKQRKDLKSIDDVDAVKQLKRNQFDVKKKILTRLNDVKVQKLAYNKELDQLNRQGDKYRKHMKDVFQKDEIEFRLKKLEDRLANDTLSLADEKEMSKKIKSLKKALPFAEPLQKINVQIKELLVKKREGGKQSQIIYQELKVVVEKISVYSQDIELRQAAQKAERDALQPLAKDKKEEHVQKIRALLDKKQEVYAAHDNKWDQYWEQVNFIRRVEKMTRMKKKLFREKKQKDWQEEQDRLREEELEEKKKNPWKKEIASCKELISYCNLLIPKKEESKQEVEEPEKNVPTTTDQFKYDQVSHVVNKKDKSDDNSWLGMGGGSPAKKGRRGKGKRRKKKQKEVEVVSTLLHSVEIVSQFTEVSVGAPNYINQVANTIKQLEEKVEYYTKLPPPDDEELEKQLDEPSDHSDEEEQDQPKVNVQYTISHAFQKKTKKRKMQQSKAYDINNLEDEFPSMGS